MMNRLKKLLAPPVFEDDEDKTRSSRLLNIVILALLTVTVIAAIVSFMFDPTMYQWPTILLIAACVGMFVFMRSGYINMTSMSLIVILFSITSFFSWLYGGMHNTATTAYFLVAVMAGVLLGVRASFIFGGLGLLATLSLLLGEINGLLIVPADLSITSYLDWFVFAAALVTTILLFNYTLGVTTRAFARARRNERALAERADEIAVFKAMADNASTGILMAKTSGAITYSNRAANAMFGYTDMDGLLLDELITQQPGQVVQQMQNVTASRGDRQGEVTLKRRNGSLLESLTNVFVVRDEAGEPIALTAIVQDITAQKHAEIERAALQQQVIEAQKNTLRELSSPIIPVVEGIIIMPLVGNIDPERAKEITHTLLAGVTQHRARVVILDITGVPLVDSDVADYLNKTLCATRLKGAQVIITGISDAVAETIVELGIDWRNIKTLRNLQTGLMVAVSELDIGLSI